MYPNNFETDWILPINKELLEVYLLDWGVNDLFFEITYLIF